MSFPLGLPTHNTGDKPMPVEKFVELINSKIIGSVSGYNYSAHDPEKEGEYYSWPLGYGGNTIFEIPANTDYKFDPHQNVIQSNKIRFVKFKK